MSALGLLYTYALVRFPDQSYDVSFSIPAFALRPLTTELFPFLLHRSITVNNVGPFGFGLRPLAETMKREKMVKIK